MKKTILGRLHNKKKTVFVIGLILIIASVALIAYGVSCNSVLFDRVYSRAFGSDHIRVLRDGEVLCDSETEDPNHQENWVVVGRLDGAKLSEFMDKMNSDSEAELREYIRDSLGCIKD